MQRKNCMIYSRIRDFESLPLKMCKSCSGNADDSGGASGSAVSGGKL